MPRKAKPIDTERTFQAVPGSRRGSARPTADRRFSLPPPRPTRPPVFDGRASARFRRVLTEWFQRSGRDLPWRRRHDAYAVLVSEFMLQQTQVSTVIPYFERWLARFPDFAALAAAEEQSVLEVWQGLGYYARARNLHRAARQVVERHGGELPGDLEAIAALPGVGRYTAGAIASFAFDLPAAAVDGNIARVLARVFDYEQAIDSTSGSVWLWAAAHNLLPAKGGRIHTSALMELGALICTARKPGCLICPVRGFCATRSPELLPVKKLRLKTVAVDEDCAWVASNGRVLLEHNRPGADGAVLETKLRPNRRGSGSLCFRRSTALPIIGSHWWSFARRPLAGWRRINNGSASGNWQKWRWRRRTAVPQSSWDKRFP